MLWTDRVPFLIIFRILSSDDVIVTAEHHCREPFEKPYHRFGEIDGWIALNLCDPFHSFNVFDRYRKA